MPGEEPTQPLADALTRGDPAAAAAVFARYAEQLAHLAVRLVVTMARAMAVAHASGVVHRDLKPSNVMVTPADEPVVMDFGLAMRVMPDASRMTMSGSFLGTPAYMPPEQVTGDTAAVGRRSDVYSLGVILYELLTGRLPFSGTLGEVVNRVLNEPPVPPSRLRPGLDPRVEAVCLKAMAKRPADRYAGMTEFAAALEGTRAEPVRSHRRWVWPAAVVAVVAIVLGVVISNRPRQQSNPDAPPGPNAGAEPAAPQQPDPKPVAPKPHPTVPPKPEGTRRLTADQKQQLNVPARGITAVGFGPNGRAMTAGGGRVVRTWDLKTGAEIEDAQWKSQFADHFAFQPGGARLAWAWVDELNLTDLRTGEIVNHVQTMAMPIHAIAFSADGKRVILGQSPNASDGGHAVVVWPINSKQKYWLGGFRHRPVALALSADGKRAITAGEDGVLWFDV
ncbi:MAG TPA: protein kinase, partial [Gemmataceae bacterium]|nr:protein kinase [Gemmataceae bacterium]